MTRRKTTEEFVAEAREVFGERFDYSEAVFSTLKAKVKLRCIEHDRWFEQRADAHLDGRDGCPLCKPTRPLTKQEFEFRGKAIFGDRFDYTEVVYTCSDDRVQIRCKEHDCYFEQIAWGHLAGQVGCRNCRSLSTKLTQAEFIEQSISIFGHIFDYSLTIYISREEKVKLRCIKHDITFEQSARSHLQGSFGCPKCSGVKLLTQSEFELKSKSIFGETYDYSLSVYMNNSTSVKIICRIHGVFEQIPRNHFSGHGCRDCGILARTYTTEEFVAAAREVHADKFDYSKTVYTGQNDHVIIICPIHSDFTQSPANHLVGRGCRLCSIDNQYYTQNEYIDLVSSIHDGKYDYSKTVYTMGKNYITIICPKHGEFDQQAGNHLQGHGCSKCTSYVSKSETEWLDSLDIPHEYRQKTLRVDDVRYRVDAYNPTTNTVYEFNGDYWHGNPTRHNPDEINERSGRTFGELYQATLDKRASLETAGYAVVSIWESDFKKLLRKAM
jgi:hypothetical protein